MTICTSGDNLNTKLSSTGWLTNLHIAIEAYKYFANQQDDTFSCLLYTSPSPRDVEESRMPSSA